jgi:hypothetical protein
MHPLVSGAEAKRYTAPTTDMWLLFPYEHITNQISLIPEAQMKTTYPKAWAHLKHYEQILRGRESSRDSRDDTTRPFDDDAWYRFGRHQNLDKQHFSKLIVAGTVPSMRVSFDEAGDFALNNVRVNGILVAHCMDPWFLLGVLNAPVVGS